MFGLGRKENIDVIENDENIIKLHTINGTVNAKKILSVNGKHVVFVDQYGNVRDAPKVIYFLAPFPISSHAINAG